MRNPRTILLISLLLAPLSFGTDTIEMKTGEKVEGVFKQANSDGVVVEVAGQPITISLAKVRAIYLGAAAAPAKGPSAAADAIDALTAIQSVTNAGVNLRDYTTRMLNAKVLVDKYLASAENNDQATRSSVRVAMRFYELIGLAWNAELTHNAGQVREIGAAVRTDESISACPLIKKLIEDSDTEAALNAVQNAGMKMSPQNRAALNAQMMGFNIYLTGARLGQRPNAYWPCADNSIAEAKRASDIQ